MSDYIRREDAIKAVHEEFDDCVVWDESGERTADEVESIIDRVLSADVAPVRHARWRHYEGMYACEDCGAQLDDESPFCPMCGAKMDGGENG